MTFRREIYGYGLLLGWLSLDISADMYLKNTSDPASLAVASVKIYYERTVGVESLLPIFFFGTIFFLIASHAFRFILERSARDLVSAMLSGALLYIYVERMEVHLHQALSDAPHALQYLHIAHDERLLVVGIALVSLVITLSSCGGIPYRMELFFLAIVFAMTLSDGLFDIPAQLWSNDVAHVNAAVVCNTIHNGGVIHAYIAPAITVVVSLLALYRVATRGASLWDGLVLLLIAIAAPLFLMIVEPRQLQLEEIRKFKGGNTLLGPHEQEHLHYIAMCHLFLLLSSVVGSIVSGLAVLRRSADGKTKRD